MKNKILLLVLSAFPFLLSAQPSVDMADGMRSSGKIYVVVGVILIIFAGIIAYLIRLERKISRIEKSLDN
jgi:cytochrome bd-type quinol oxidase subunit 2